jgi:hypothetical protein
MAAGAGADRRRDQIAATRQVTENASITSPISAALVKGFHRSTLGGAAGPRQVAHKKEPRGTSPGDSQTSAQWSL